MCGRYTLFIDREDLEERFDARFDVSYERRYNAAPGQRLPVITDVDAGTIRALEWGFVPSWAADDDRQSINARAETLAETPSFRAAYEGGDGGSSGDGENTGQNGRRTAGRCLVLADGFYEWAEAGDGDGKRPYRIAYADDRPFAMAGLWSRWEPETTQTGLGAFGGGSDAGADGDGDGADEPDAGGAIETFAIVTTEPNDLVADLHDRMAAILEPGAERRWLTDDDPRAVLGPLESADLTAYPVSRAVNSPANDRPSLVEPVEG